MSVWRTAEWLTPSRSPTARNSGFCHGNEGRQPSNSSATGGNSEHRGHSRQVDHPAHEGQIAPHPEP
jgi:hypothetical protein